MYLMLWSIETEHHYKVIQKVCSSLNIFDQFIYINRIVTQFDSPKCVVSMFQERSYAKICRLQRSEKMWRCRGSNPGPFTCEANALPLSHIPVIA